MQAQALHLSVLLEDEVVCLMSSHDRRAAGGLALEQYRAATANTVLRKPAEVLCRHRTEGAMR
jgi:hypothetical protein